MSPIVAPWLIVLLRAATFRQGCGVANRSERPPGGILSSFSLTPFLSFAATCAI